MKKYNPSPDKIAQAIEAFVNGTCGPYDWDDFMTCPSDNPELEAIRKECEQVETQFPARGPNEWCNPEGGQTLLKIAQRIRGKAQP
ncbi:MAG: hypothetical protein A2283_12755 [Lentisphaerae bacterium RIFOXYA12_FULL_48_11]|nr:MAG: hypothetical protein A2283_12755 [Lentisphaerae bacterium RIFOXYA12_FULL_48_11]